MLQLKLPTTFNLSSERVTVHVSFESTKQNWKKTLENPKKIECQNVPLTYELIQECSDRLNLRHNIRRHAYEQ